eukprot:5813238-Pyramimonas_sp.AAC.1
MDSFLDGSETFKKSEEEVFTAYFQKHALARRHTRWRPLPRVQGQEGPAGQGGCSGQPGQR